MLEAHSLTRRYGDFTAVRDVDFTVQEGEILGILGPNGAGKTTTIRMLTGFLSPTAGRVSVAGHDLEKEPLRARAEIGYLPENVALYPEMRVEEYLAYRGRLEGVPKAELPAALDRAVSRTLIGDVRRQIIGTLSKGYRQRVGLAGAILHNPRVLILDEPTVGLDPKQIIAIRELIRELGEAHTLLLSTHILPEVELLCDRVLILDKGRIVDQGTPEALRDRWRGNSLLRVTLKGDPEDASRALGAVPGAIAVRAYGEEPGRWVVEGDRDADLREPVFRTAVDRGWVLLELVEEKASLEDIFVRLTTTEDPAAAEEGTAAGSEEPLAGPPSDRVDEPAPTETEFETESPSATDEEETR